MDDGEGRAVRRGEEGKGEEGIGEEGRGRERRGRERGGRETVRRVYTDQQILDS
jgi:hypothetical protein